MNALKNVILITLITCGILTVSIAQESPSLYDMDFSMDSLTGGQINLADLKGKKVLFVNVASKCGYTPQYADLQKLSKKYQDKLIVIGVPCDQFGGQEPGTSKDIASFCKVNYGVEFLITQKVDVKGKNQHDLYKWLTNKSFNGKEDSSVNWNFQKYLVDEKGQFIRYFPSSTRPLSPDILQNL